MVGQKDQCTKIVRGPREWAGHRCPRSTWKDGYCKQHHPETVEARRQQSIAAAALKHQNSIYARLDRAVTRIKELEAEIGRLREELAAKNER